MTKIQLHILIGMLNGYQFTGFHFFNLANQFPNCCNRFVFVRQAELAALVLLYRNCIIDKVSFILC